MLSCVWLFCNPMDCSPPGSCVHGVLQARILEWVAISSSRGSSWPRDQTHISCIGRMVLYCWATREAHIYLYKYVYFLRPSALYCLASCTMSGFLVLKVKVSQSCLTRCDLNSPGHNTGVGSLSLFQGVFPIQGSNPCLPHCRRILYQLSHKEILEWVVYSFSSGIFLTQESNQSLLHCRQILYQLSDQGSLQSAGKGSNWRMWPECYCLSFLITKAHLQPHCLHHTSPSLKWCSFLHGSYFGWERLLTLWDLILCICSS